MKSKKRFFWTFEEILKEAKKHKTYTAFQKKSTSAYNAAIRMGLLKKVEKLTRLKRLQKPRNYWDKEKLIEEALKYDSRKEFQINSGSAYGIAHARNYSDEICKHMKPIGNRFKRGLYAFEHPDKTVYVGLTYNYKRRYREHMKNNKILIKKKREGGQVFKTFDILYDHKVAAKEEIKLINRYRNQGWIILNKIKGGGLGGSNRRWTPELIAKEALKYKTRGEFFKKSTSAYVSAKTLLIFNKVTKHMPKRLILKGPDNCHFKWTEEKLIEEALKYKTIKEFRTKSCGAYSTAYKRDILDKICVHMN